MAEPWSAPPCAKANAAPLPSKTRTLAMSQLYALYRFETRVGASAESDKRRMQPAMLRPLPPVSVASFFSWLHGVQDDEA
jgi:hypothetical protein